MKRTPVDDEKYQDITWHEDAAAYAATFGLEQKDVESIVLSRSRPTLDSRSGEVGHLIVRYRAGDVVVVVGHREPEHPVIMSVWVDSKQKLHRGSKGAGSTSGSSLPTTMKQLQRRILDDGFKIKVGGAHLRVEDSDGTLVASLPSTPSDYRSIPNAWKYYQRKKIEHERKKKESA